jgi:hypothetical protein
MPIDEWQEEVERLLTHHFGMNHSAFLDFLGSMSRRLTGNALEKCLLARQTIQNSKPT